MFNVLERLEPRRLFSAGQVDTSFGDQGHLVDTSFTAPPPLDASSPAPAAVARMVIAPGGDLVTAGSGNGTGFISRYTPDGVPDATFNGTGHEYLFLRLNANAYFWDLPL